MLQACFLLGNGCPICWLWRCMVWDSLKPVVIKEASSDHFPPNNGAGPREYTTVTLTSHLCTTLLGLVEAIQRQVLIFPHCAWHLFLFQTAHSDLWWLIETLFQRLFWTSARLLPTPSQQLRHNFYNYQRHFEKQSGHRQGVRNERHWLHTSGERGK